MPYGTATRIAEDTMESLRTENERLRASNERLRKGLWSVSKALAFIREVAERPYADRKVRRTVVVVSRDAERTIKDL